jgi:hypothetical protein
MVLRVFIHSNLVANADKYVPFYKNIVQFWNAGHINCLVQFTDVHADGPLILSTIRNILFLCKINYPSRTRVRQQ